jgi:predicted negative regulator of RcsB-dependent stress response
MAGLAADLKGDVLQAKGQSAEAIAAYKTAWTQLTDSPEYRRLVQAKLNALGVDPQATSSTGTAK